MTTCSRRSCDRLGTLTPIVVLHPVDGPPIVEAFTSLAVCPECRARFVECFIEKFIRLVASKATESGVALDHDRSGWEMGDVVIEKAFHQDAGRPN